MDWFGENDYELYQSYSVEESRVLGMANSIWELEKGAQFSFYDLRLSEYDQYVLSQIEINHYDNAVIYTPKANGIHGRIYDIVRDFVWHQSKAQSQYINDISGLILRLTSNVLSAGSYDGAEVIIRVMGAYQEDDCEYWHIDKTRNHSTKADGASNELMEELSKDKKWNFSDKVFLISLTGEYTVYQSINNVVREKFHSVANETIFYYGHDNECRKMDAITALFQNGNDKMAKYDYGSVHTVGKNGAIHKAPDKSKVGRMILIITPTINS